MSLARREFLVPFLAGLAGAVLIVPYELALLGPVAPALLRALVVAGLVQAALVIAIAVAAGLWFAHRAGLGAPILEGALRGEPFGARLRGVLPVAVALVLASSAALLLLEALVFEPGLPALASRAARGAAGLDRPPRVVLRRHHRRAPHAALRRVALHVALHPRRSGRRCVLGGDVRERVPPRDRTPAGDRGARPAHAARRDARDRAQMASPASNLVGSSGGAASSRRCFHTSPPTSSSRFSRRR